MPEHYILGRLLGCRYAPGHGNLSISFHTSRSHLLFSNESAQRQGR